MPSKDTADKAPRRSPSILGMCLQGMVSLITVSLFSGLLLLMTFSAYCAYQGLFKTVKQMDAIVEVNIDLLMANERYRLFEITQVWMTQQLAKAGLGRAISHIENTANAIGQEVHLPDRGKTTAIQRLQKTWQKISDDFIAIGWGVTVVLSTRLFILCLALPLLIVFLMIGLVDGLVQRDIRKFQNARESAYWFHRIKRLGLNSVYLPILLYLACPLAVSPLWFLVPLAIWWLLLIQMASRSFKKYV